MATDRRGRRWALPLIGLLACATLVVAGLFERSRSCERHGGIATRAGTRCEAPEAFEYTAGASGSIAFEPSIPDPSAVITATFTTLSPAFANTPRVVLRARVLPGMAALPWKVGSVVELATLDAVGNGRFIGSFRLPANVRYARIAVETASGEAVDANRGSLYELVTGAHGEVSYDALVARAQDHLVHEPAVLVETGRMLQRLEPSRPWGAYARVAGESALDDFEREAEYAAKSARLYRRYDSRLRRQERVEAIDIELMMSWAQSDFDNEAVTYWSNRALVEHPRSVRGIQARLANVVNIADASVRLDSLEALWNESSTPDFRTSRAGLNAAEQKGDTALFMRWLDRDDPGSSMVHTLARYAVRGIASEFLDQRLRVWADSLKAGGVITPVPGETSAETRRNELRVLAELVSTHGWALLIRGLVPEALSMLEAVPDSALEADVFLARARARRAAGDDAGALEDLILAAVHGESRTTALADTARVWFGAEVADGVWRHRVLALRAERERALAAEPAGESIADYRITDANGVTRTVGEIGAGHPMVLAVLRVHGLTGGAMGAADAVAHGLAAEGVKWLWLDIEAGDPVATPWHEQRSLQRAVDDELLAVLEPRFMPQYYVLDGAGRIRHTTSAVRDVHTRAVALARQR